MNVLITSAAAKVLLVEAFQEALAGRGRVFTADLTADCAAAQFSDRHFVIGPMADPATVLQLAALCEEQGVRLLVPSRDGELLLLAESMALFAAVDTKVLVAPPEVVRICQDKGSFCRFLQANGLPALPLLEPAADRMIFPTFARPITGAGGRGTRRLENWADVVALGDPAAYLIHPFIDAPEYSIDLLMNLDGSVALDAVCRERIQIVAGESKISRVVDLPNLSALACELGRKLRLVGHNTVQMFFDARHGPLIIEVNPRFGGASNLSIRAGLDSPRRILQLLRGDESALMPRSIAFGMTMFRYSRDVLIAP